MNLRFYFPPLKCFSVSFCWNWIFLHQLRKYKIFWYFDILIKRFLNVKQFRASHWRFLKKLVLHSVHPPPPFCWGGGEGGVNLLPNFQKGGSLTGPQFLEGVCWERGGWLFSEGVKFFDKNKLKSEIFNDKKVYKQEFFALS